MRTTKVRVEIEIESIFRSRSRPEEVVSALFASHAVHDMVLYLSSAPKLPGLGGMVVVAAPLRLDEISAQSLSAGVEPALTAYGFRVSRYICCRTVELYCRTPTTGDTMRGAV